MRNAVAGSGIADCGMSLRIVVCRIVKLRSGMRIPDCEVTFRHPCVFGALSGRERRVGRATSGTRLRAAWTVGLDSSILARWIAGFKTFHDAGNKVEIILN